MRDVHAAGGEKVVVRGPRLMSVVGVAILHDLYVTRLRYPQKRRIKDREKPRLAYHGALRESYARQRQSRKRAKVSNDSNDEGEI